MDLKAFDDVLVDEVDDIVNGFEVRLDFLFVLFEGWLAREGVFEEGEEGSSHGALEEGGKVGSGVSSGAWMRLMKSEGEYVHNIYNNATNNFVVALLNSRRFIGLSRQNIA